MGKKIIIGVVILLLVALVVTIAVLVNSGALKFQFGTEPPSSRLDGEVASLTPPVPNAAPSAVTEWQEPPLTAEGRLFPLRQASLSFEVEGTLQRLLVEEGDEVTVGTLLAQLDSTSSN